MNANLSMYELL